MRSLLSSNREGTVPSNWGSWVDLESAQMALVSAQVDLESAQMALVSAQVDLVEGSEVSAQEALEYSRVEGWKRQWKVWQSTQEALVVC
ncbi:UNVERIFIED_CONTAM: hypothetical protein NCL1_59447 [Trichonephila clavipes]